MTKQSPRRGRAALAILAAILPAALASTSSPAGAQIAAPRDTAGTDTTIARRLETVTVTAVRGTGARATSHTLLDSTTLERQYVGQDMTRVLEHAPGVTAYSENGAGNNYSYIRLRGIDQTRINFTLDGIPLNEPEDQGLFFSNFPDFARSVRTAEVQRGVGTSSNGTASYAGSVSFESIPLAGSRRGGEASATAGSFGTKMGALEYRTGQADNGLAGYGRVSVHTSDGYRRNSGNRSVSGFLSGAWIGERDVVKSFVLAGRSQMEMAYYAASEEELAADRRSNPLGESDDFSQGFAGVSHSRALNAATSLSTTVYGSASDGWYDVARSDGSIQKRELTSRWGGALSTLSWQGSRWRIDAGAHASRYARDHRRSVRPNVDVALYENTGTKTDVSAFGKTQVALGALTLHGDLQLRRASLDYEPDANADLPNLGVDWDFANPKLGATLQVAPAASVYASWGRTGREPARSDLFAGEDNITRADYDAMGGTLARLRPERVDDFEAGFSWGTPAVSLNAGAFAMLFQDEIAPTGEISASTGSPLHENVDRSSRLGVELDGAWRAAERMTLHGDLTLMRARMKSYTEPWSGQTFTDVAPMLTPSVTSNHGLTLGLVRSLDLMIDGRYVGESHLTNTGDEALMLPSRYNVDAGVEWSAGRGTIGLGVRNVGNVTAYGSGYAYDGVRYFYVEAPRSLYVTMRAGF
ncbi:MAG TPA: TonB-dependent receptor [Gemmatimonadaceae bacterium]|nr:TonB-dependent receptor [Gemmatimonadaceae bacterium]